MPANQDFQLNGEPVRRGRIAKGTPIETLELGIVKKMQRSVTFVPASAPKRFINTLSEHSKLTDKGRAYLAFCAHRYRRQWQADPEEAEWIRIHFQPKPVATLPTLEVAPSL